MRTQLRRFTACLLAAALAVCLLPAGSASTEGAVFQMVVNDRFLEMNAATMPFRSEGIPYVPYIVFDWNVTGVRFGISSFVTQTDGEYTLTLYSIGGTLRFDLLKGTCEDPNAGEAMNMRAISRNGMIFVPLGGVCRYFGLSSDLTPTSYDTLLRIVNGQQSYDTNKFIEVATTTGRLQERYNNYIRGQGTAATAAPSAPASPTPDGGEGGPDKQGVRLYLAFECGDTEGLESILTTLERGRIQALFLFRPEDLAEQDGLVRQVVGSGHSVGLMVPGESGEAALAALRQGSGVLERAARLRTHTASAEGASSETAEALRQAGWACWIGNVNGLPDGRGQAARGSAVLEDAQARRGSVYITLDAGRASAGVLSYILPRLRSEGYSIRPAVETQL